MIFGPTRHLRLELEYIQSHSGRRYKFHRIILVVSQTTTDLHIHNELAAILCVNKDRDFKAG